MAAVVSKSSSKIVWLINAAFLQEIKDSNPHLWHAFHSLRTLCQLEPEDCDSPQATIKSFIACFDELRDLVALQFALEESYGFLSTPAPQHTGASLGIDPSLEDALQVANSLDERQSMICQVMDQHRKLYLQIVDLVEQAEELQYRGCEVSCLKDFAQKAESFSRDFTAHERLEGELIRLHGSNSAIPAAVGYGNRDQEYDSDLTTDTAQPNVLGDSVHVR